MTLLLSIKAKGQEELIGSLTTTVQNIRDSQSTIESYEEIKENISFLDAKKELNHLFDSLKEVYKYEIEEIKYDFGIEISSINNLIKEYLKDKEYSLIETYSESILEEIKHKGTMGRLFIPNVGINVGLYESGFSGSKNAQAIVDRIDSAAWMCDMEVVVVADHKNQGFEGIKKAIENETIAYVSNGEKIDSYICIKKRLGTNDGCVVRDDNGEPLACFNEEYGSTPYIVMYTCNENWMNITVTVWRKIS